MTALDVETPAPVVDLDRLERNLARWQRRCDELGLDCRPHIKTHKCVEIARRQLELGAAGLTCQTIGEAETMAAAGFDDLLLTTNVLGDLKLARLARLLERATVTVVVDDLHVLPGLTQAAARSGRPLRVLVECDTGHAGWASAHPARPPTSPLPSSAATRSLSAASSRIRSRPVRSSSSRRPSTRRRGAGSRPAWCRSAGRPPCGRSTVRPTVTEYRAGTYAFHDRATVAAGAATLEDVALTVCATVVSRPTRDRAILDAGSKSLSSDRSAADGFGLVLEAPESTLVRLDEEHGYLELANGDDVDLGQQVRIVPNHACAVSNLFAEFVLMRDGELAGRWTVDARGR